MANLRRDEVLDNRSDILKRITSLSLRIAKMKSKKWIRDIPIHYENVRQLEDRRVKLKQRLRLFDKK